MSKEAVAVGLLGIMVAAWGWALRPATPRAPATTAVVPVRVVADETVPRVRFGTLTPARVVRPAPVAARNPFLRGALPPRAGANGSRHDLSVPPVAAATAAESQVAAPRVRLIGMAEKRVGDGVTHVAILAGRDGVSHAQVGDLIDGTYRVARIAADEVELTSLADGTAMRLPWRP